MNALSRPRAVGMDCNTSSPFQCLRTTTTTTTSFLLFFIFILLLLLLYDYTLLFSAACLLFFLSSTYVTCEGILAVVILLLNQSHHSKRKTLFEYGSSALFIDDLNASYLQQLEILDSVLKVFLNKINKKLHSALFSFSVINLK